MVIKKMNSVFHKHSRWLFGAFTVVIIISFLGFLTPGNFGGGLGSAKNAAIGVAYGKKITYDDLVKKMRALASIGYNANEQMAFGAICVQAKAAQLGISVTDAELKDLLRSQFQTNGKYDREKYRAFLNARHQNGFTEEDIFDGFRTLQLDQKLSRELRSSVVITDSEVQKAYRELNTRFSGKGYTLKPQESKESIPTEEVRKFFDKHASNYVLDGSLAALVIEFPYANYMDAAKKAEKDPAKVTEKAKSLAKAAAEKFSDDVYDALKSLPAKEQLAAFKEKAAKQKYTVKERKFKFNMHNISNLTQTDYALMKASEPVEISTPVLEEKAAAVGFVFDRVAPRPAKFEEVAKEVFKDCKEVRTALATEAKAKEFAEKYAKCKDDAARAALLKQVPVAKTGDFSLTIKENIENRSKEKTDNAAQEKFLAAACGIAPGQAAASGDMLVVLSKREVPTGTAPAEALMDARALVFRTKLQAAQWAIEEDINNHCQYRGFGSGAAKK